MPNALRASVVHSVNVHYKLHKINVISPSGAGNRHFCDLLARVQDDINIILK